MGVAARPAGGKKLNSIGPKSDGAMTDTLRGRSKPIAVLLLAALLISGCKDDASGFGGPYYLGGGTKNVDKIMANNKNGEFRIFKDDKKWKSSKVAILDKDLFVKSIQNNKASRVPAADKFQKYNYVVKDGKIRVAVWDGSKENDLNDICNPGLPYAGMPAPSNNTMVNFYPEDPTKAHGGIADKQNESCRATVGNKPVGVLDAHSKHFMLAQGENARISDYGAAKKWEDKTVAYAGEILVVLGENSCFYALNQGSGTYKPDSGTSKENVDHLKAVAALFEKTIGMSPLYVWDDFKKAQWFLPTKTPLQCP